jgi:hypothetical protein
VLKNLLLGLRCAISVVLKGDSADLCQDLLGSGEEYFIFTAFNIHFEEINVKQMVLLQNLFQRFAGYLGSGQGVCRGD